MRRVVFPLVIVGRDVHDRVAVLRGLVPSEASLEDRGVLVTPHVGRVLVEVSRDMPSLGELEPKFSRYLFTGVQQ